MICKLAVVVYVKKTKRENQVSNKNLNKLWKLIGDEIDIYLAS